MVDKLKVINFLQDFGCARQEQLQILFDDPDNNFKSILSGNMISKKDDIECSIPIIYCTYPGLDIIN